MKLSKFRFVLAVMLGFSTCSFIYAQENTVSSSDSETILLSVDDAIKYAVEGNISLKQSAISLESARRAKNYSWGSVSPKLTAGASIQGSDSTTQFGLSGSVSMGLSPAIISSIKAAAISYEQSLMTYDNAVKSIELAVRKTYYSILYEQENIKLQTQNLANSKKQYESNLARYNRGTLSRLDVLSTQVTYQNAAVTLETLKSTLENDLATFKQTLGIPQDKKIELAGSFDTIDQIGEISIEGIEVKSKDVESLELQITAAKNSLLASRLSAWGPTLSASYSYTYGGLTEYPDKAEGKNTYSFGVSIPLDGYLPWSTGGQSIANSKASIESLELKREDAATTLQVQINNYLKKIKQSQESIKLRKESISLAQQSFEMTTEAYNHGTKDLLSLQSSQNNLLSAKLNLMSEEFTLISAILDLENTLGVPFGTLYENK